MEETSLGGMSVKWQNGTDRQIDTLTDRHTDTPTDRQDPGLILSQSLHIEFFKERF
jgi:hypothetical protein